MAELINGLKDLLVSALSAAIVSLCIMGWNMLKEFAHAKIAQVKSNTENEKMAAVLNALETICDDVSASFDPVAEELKKANADGKLTKDDIEKLKEDARDAAMLTFTSIFSMDTLRNLGITDDAVKDMVARAIEASLQRRKKS